jgi:hypothetical protein
MNFLGKPTNATSGSLRISLLEERVKKLEEKVFKKLKRTSATKSQKVLLYKELGLLDIIDELDLSQNKKALLISVLIEGDPDNIEEDLRTVRRPNSDLKTAFNYRFLREFYDDLGLNKQASNAQKVLNKIEEEGQKRKKI